MKKCNMNDLNQQWVMNKAQKRIYNSAAPSLCLSSYGTDGKLRMLDCKNADKWEKTVGYSAIRSIRYYSGTKWVDDPKGIEKNAITIFNWYALFVCDLL